MALVTTEQVFFKVHAQAAMEVSHAAPSPSVHRKEQKNRKRNKVGKERK